MPLTLNRRKQRPRRDQTGTFTLRRRLQAELKRRFAELRKRIAKLVVTDDAFGLRDPLTANLFVTNPSYFETCPRDERGRCIGGGGGESEQPLAQPPARTGPVPHNDVLNTVADSRNAWGYKEPMSLIEGEGRTFEVGGVTWKEGGNCVLDTGHVTIYDNGKWSSTDAVKRITGHEMMHGTYEKVVKVYDNERDAIFAAEREMARQYDEAHPGEDRGLRARALDDMALTYPSGQLKPEAERQYPTYARLWQYREGKWDSLVKDDGVTPYSQAYWRDTTTGKVTGHIAVHETLAEIAGHHESTGVIIGSKVYKDYYKAVRDEYRVLTGSQKRRKGPGLTKNEADAFTDSVLYFDANRAPTTADKAVFMRWWRKDGTNGWATRAANDPVLKTVNVGQYDFPSDVEKLRAFRLWVQRQLKEVLTSRNEEELWKRYTEEGMKKGAGASFEHVRGKEALRAEKGEEFYDATKLEFLRSSFAQPVAVDKVKLLASRSFEDLEGVTEQMSKAMSRTLTEGLVRGDSPREVAARLVVPVDSYANRAMAIARTEIIRAHAEGQLVALKQLGVEKLNVQVEWSPSGLGVTALGNLSPCPECAEHAGEIYDIDEAQGLIPLHPNCMCSWIPAVPEDLLEE